MGMPTLKNRYEKDVRPKLQEKLGFSNPNRLPRLLRVVVNMGMGIVEKDVLKKLTDELTKITGQKPVQTRSRKSISNFKLREGMVIGAKVTLRGDRMYEFLQRLITAALPKIRDFRGLSPRSFDGRGSYTFGVKEQTIFPEIDPNDVSVSQGMDITIVTSAKSNDEAKALLELMGMPFAKH
jgi:large subunit ribosomal protein L5